MRPYLEKTLYKKRAGGVAQGEGLEFKPQCEREKKGRREGETEGGRKEGRKKKKEKH
jgi:hypothetical protein